MADMGLSDKPDDAKYEYTLQSRINDLEALLKHAGVDGPVTLAVHDWGGMSQPSHFQYPVPSNPRFASFIGLASVGRKQHFHCNISLRVEREPVEDRR